MPFPSKLLQVQEHLGLVSLMTFAQRYQRHFLSGQFCICAIQITFCISEQAFNRIHSFQANGNMGKYYHVQWQKIQNTVHILLVLLLTVIILSSWPELSGLDHSPLWIVDKGGSNRISRLIWPPTQLLGTAPQILGLII